MPASVSSARQSAVPGAHGGEGSRWTHIGSRSNPTFKALRLLAGSARERRRQQRTVLDGPHLLESYLASGGRPILIAVSEAARGKREIDGLLERARASEIVCLAPGLFAQLAPVDTPVGILALIDIPSVQGSATRGELLVLLDGIQDPGNVGAIIRSAAAAGADAVLLSAKCADPWSPRVLRAAMGTHFALRVHCAVDLAMAIGRFHGRAIAASGHGGVAPHAIDLSGPVALLFGSEGGGLDPVLAQAAAASISIPLARGIESLNVAAAAAVILFERARQLDAIRARKPG